MSRSVIIVLVFISNFVFAQTAETTFDNANRLYKEGKFQEAIKLYNDVEASGNVSSELYYNLGNCFYKLNKVAPTIYNYEKALQLDPLNEDAQNNLVFAKRLTLDRIEALPKSVLQKINEGFFQKLTYNTWAIISVLFSVLASVLFLLFYFAYTTNRKRLFFTTSILSFILLITTLIITYQQYGQSINTVEAIIFTEEIAVKNAPTNNADEVFTLHEGTKVKILDAVDDWKKIKLIDGKIGWMLAKDLKLLNKI